jgi:hypothetical protein
MKVDWLGVLGEGRRFYELALCLELEAMRLLGFPPGI